MKIAIDIRPLQGDTKHRGIGKALQRTLLDFSKLILINDDNLVLIYDPTLNSPEINFIKCDYELIPIKTSRFSKKKYLRVIFRQYKLLNINKSIADCLLQFDFTLGVPKNIPTVVMFHDLIPVLFRKEDIKNQSKSSGIIKIKQNLGGALQWRRYTEDLKQFRNASRILAISKNSRSDLLKFDKEISNNTVKVCYLGVSQVLSTNLDTSLDAEIKKFINSNYLLYVGGIDTRKNIAQLVKELHILKKTYPDLKLVAVGNEFSLKKNLEQVGWTEEIRNYPELEKDIILPGFVSDYELQILYKNARCFVFPSLYEGFGMPVLEAMAFSCPVVAYSNSSIPEVAGNAALLVKPSNMMSDAIRDVIDDDKLRNRLIKEGLTQYKKFPWSKSAEIIYKNLVEVSIK